MCKQVSIEVYIIDIFRKVCPLCGKRNSRDRALDRHHISYEPEIVIQICVRCHGRIHSRTYYRSLNPFDEQIQEWRNRNKEPAHIPDPTIEELIETFPSKKFLLEKASIL